MDSTTPGSFENLGIAPKLLDILSKLKFTTPTPIQQQSIPSAVLGKDIMGIAQTGTGKTLAFGVPMIQRLAQSKGAAKGLILLPTRELAMQVNETLKRIGSNLGLKTAVLIGGEPIHRQRRSLQQDPHIIIATPGRLIDHLETTNLSLSKVNIVVLDEADRMLDMGFAPQLKKVFEKVPKTRQTMLFSATMPDTILNMAKSYMTLPLRIEVAPAGTAIELVTQELFIIRREEKLSLLKTILDEYKGSILIFSRTKHGAKKIATAVRNMKHTATEIHSNRSLNQRIEALEGFKLGKYRVLVATDIAARGIHVTGIQLVVNFDLPDNAEDYVHRIGRTARAGRAGKAISFATPDQRGDIKSIERLIRTSLPVKKAPELEKIAFAPQAESDYRPSSAPRRSFAPSRGNSGGSSRPPFQGRPSQGRPTYGSGGGRSGGGGRFNRSNDRRPNDSRSSQGGSGHSTGGGNSPSRSSRPSRGNSNFRGKPKFPRPIETDWMH